MLCAIECSDDTWGVMRGVERRCKCYPLQAVVRAEGIPIISRCAFLWFGTTLLRTHNPVRSAIQDPRNSSWMSSGVSFGGFTRDCLVVEEINCCFVVGYQHAGQPSHPFVKFVPETARASIGAQASPGRRGARARACSPRPARRARSALPQPAGHGGRLRR